MQRKACNNWKDYTKGNWKDYTKGDVYILQATMPDH